MLLHYDTFEIADVLVTLLRSERLQLLRVRRAELVGLVATSEHKPDNQTFIEVLKNRIADIDQLLADVEHHRA